MSHSLSRYLSNTLSTRWVHWAARGLVATIFLFVLLDLFMFPLFLEPGFGLKMLWEVWWPLFPLMFLLAGRFWCDICPFSTVGELAQAPVRSTRTVPKILREKGAYLALLFFVVLSIIIETTGVEESAASTALLLVIVLSGIVLCSVLWPGHVWCRHLCPLGGISSIYAKAGIVSLDCDMSKCIHCKNKLCNPSSPSNTVCPLFETPNTLSSMSNCNLCGVCLEKCRLHALSFRIRFPGAELWNERNFAFEEALIALTVFGFVLTTLALDYLGEGAGYLPTLGASLSACFALYLAAAQLLSKTNGESFRLSFVRLAILSIPLILFSHGVHILNEVLEGTKAITVLRPLLLTVGLVISGYGFYRQRDRSVLLPEPAPQ